MPNQLFEQMGGGKLHGQMGQFQQMIGAFRQFKQNFRGDPQQEVQKLLNSGQMTQQQYTQLRQIADQMAYMIGR